MEEASDRSKWKWSDALNRECVTPLKEGLLSVFKETTVKKLMVIVSICGWICVDATRVSAQEMRAKSNEIYLKLNEPRSRTSVPVISWLTPQQDYTHSTEMQIT